MLKDMKTQTNLKPGQKRTKRLAPLSVAFGYVQNGVKIPGIRNKSCSLYAE